ncbi:MAG: (d)CMP kinase [Thermoplasmatota archaeon]
MRDSITLGGLPGSGTTTTARRLQETLHLPYVYAGHLFRELARERGMTLAEFGAYCEEHPEVDRALDKKQEMLLAAGHLILEGRLAGWIAHRNSIPAFKIWLSCMEKERVRRVAEREGESLETVRREIEAREASEKKRYRRYYDIDLDDLSIYDVVVDTTSLPPTEVEAAILEAMDGRQKLK